MKNSTKKLNFYSKKIIAVSGFCIFLLAMNSKVNAQTFETVPGNAVKLAPTGYISTHLNANTNTISMAAWVKPTGAVADWSGLITYTSGTGLNITTGGQLGVLWNDTEWDWATGVTLPADKWSHVALVVEPTKSTIYLNGVPVSHTATHAAIDFNVGDFFIGSDRGNAGRYFKGEMDEVTVYNRAITQNEIRDMMHLTHLSTETGLIGYYQFNETNNNDIKNMVNSVAALVTGGATKVVSTAPFAGGTSFRTNINASGSYSFANTGATLTFNSTGTYPNGEVAMYKLNSAPNNVPVSGTILLNNYWIMENWGENTNFDNLTNITISDINVSNAGVANPSAYKLFSRNSNEHLNTWNNACPATSAVAGINGSISYDNSCGINNERQFAIMQDASLSTTANTLENTFKVYPTPAKDVLNIVFTSENAKSNVTPLAIIDLSGKIVYKEDVRVNEGSNHLTINLPGNIINGLYLVKLGEKQAIKITVKK